MAKGIGFGSLLKIDPTGGESYTLTIGNIVESFENEVTRETVDITLFGDLYKEYDVADIEPGELAYDIALDNNEAVNQKLVDLKTAGTKVGVQVTYSNASEEPDEFKAYVVGLGRTVSKRELLTRKVTMKLSGNPGLKGSGA